MSYDSWLEAPYQRAQASEPPDEIAEKLDLEFWLDGERAVVQSWEPWEDADEDGRHGGVDFVIRTGDWTRGKYNVLQGGRTQNMSPTELDEVLADQASHGAHDCQEEAVPYTSDGALGHGWECGVCGRFLQAG